MHLSGLLARGRKWDTQPVCRTDLTPTRPILYDAVMGWWSDNTKLSGHPTIRYLWTCHHSALLRTCTLVNLSSVICCHYLMTSALACFQATKTQAIVCLNQGGDLQYMKVEYSMAFEHEAQRKGKMSNAPIVSRQQREKKWQMQAFASRPTLHLGHANLARNQRKKNKETNKKQDRSGKQNYFQSGDLTVKVHWISNNLKSVN